MKKIRIVQAVLLVAVVALITSCSPSRQNTYEPYPPARTNFSLIISSSPGMVINRYYDGRYYYRAPNGYTYWRGYDNRYYLDRTYMRRGYYSHRQYNDWKHGNRKYYKRHRRR